MAHSGNLFYRLSTSGLSLWPFNHRALERTSAFRRTFFFGPSDLIIQKNNYDCKTKTNEYLGLSSDPISSFGDLKSESCREGEVHGLRMLSKESERSFEGAVEEG